MMNMLGKVLIGIFVLIVVSVVALWGLNTVMEEKYSVKFELVDVDEAQSIPSKYAPSYPSTPGNKYVLATVTVTNVGSGSISPSIFWIQLNHNGRLYDASFVTYEYVGENSFISTTLTPNASMTFVVVFSVPMNMDGYEVAFAPPSYYSIQ